MEIKIINKSRHPLPQYATPLSAGMDLRANIDEPITLAPLARTIVPTGLFMALPAGYEAQVRPRSGLAVKKGITVLNTPGTIDADYTPATLTINGYSGLTGEDIYVVPTSLTVKNIKDPDVTESMITLMDCEVFKTYSNNKLTVWRTSIPGDTGVAIHCDVYIYY